MRVVFVSDHFSSPGEPGVLRTWRLVEHLVAAGDSVTVVAPRAYQPFSGARPRPEARPLAPSGPIRRRVLPTARPGQDGWKRLVVYLGQSLAATVHVLRERGAHVVVTGLTPSLLGVGPFVAARLKGVPFVLDERDMAIDAARTLGLLPASALAACAQVQTWLLRRVDSVLVVTPGIQRMIMDRGVSSRKVVLVPNGFESLPRPAPAEVAALRQRLGWTDEFVALYVGGLGSSHDLHLLLNASKGLPSEVRFVLAGDGPLRSELGRRVREEGLPVQFVGPFPKEQVPALCAAADVGVLALWGHPFWSCALPTKLFDYLGAGIPVVAAAPEGDAARVLGASGAGVVVPPGDAAAFRTAVVELARDRERAAALGQAGRAHVERAWRRELFLPAARARLVALANGWRPGREAPAPADDEVSRIRRVYRRYDTSQREQRKRDLRNAGARTIADQRHSVLRSTLEDLDIPHGARVLDVGCGKGADLRMIGDWFRDRDLRLHGVDVLPDRIDEAQGAVPGATFLLQDARSLPYPDGHFYAILASTLFSSVLARRAAADLARELLRVLGPGGALVCYDIRYPNPFNPHVRPVTRSTLTWLFPGTGISARSVTLLPPLARRLGRLTDPWYPAFHRLPVLRSHLVAVVRPGPTTSTVGRRSRKPTPALSGSAAR